MAQTRLKTKQTDSNVGLYQNAFINGGCEVNQLGSNTNLSPTVFVWGPVDAFSAAGSTTLTTGTFQQGVNTNSPTGFSIKQAGVTYTGIGAAVSIGYILSEDARKFKNKKGSFSVVVQHNLGFSTTCDIYINKANTTDNFSTQVAISSLFSLNVSNNTATLVKFENIALGDCSNGIEIRIYINATSPTTKDFEFYNWQFNEGTTVQEFQPRRYHESLQDCKRLYQKWVTPPLRGVFSATTAFNRMAMPLPVAMRANPTISVSGNLPLYDGAAVGTASTTITSYSTVDCIEIDGTAATGTFTTGRPALVFKTGAVEMIIDARPTI